MNKQKITMESVRLFWVFIIGSVAGYIYETVLVVLQTGQFAIRQGLLFGPLIPVYGTGAMIYYITFKHIKTRDKVKVFLITLVLGGATEYIFSWLQEVIFGSVSWDYSHLPFNLNGRTSLLHCTYWGIAGLLYMSIVEPLLDSIDNVTKETSLNQLTLILAIIIVADIAISWMAVARQKNRLLGKEPRNSVEVFLDKNFPDEFIDKILSNKKNRLDIEEE